MIAHALSANGAKVYIVGRRREELEKVVDLYKSSGSGSIIALPGDLSDKAGCLKLVQEFSEKESHLHLLVNKYV